MKAVVFVPSIPATAWAREALPWLSPAELPLAGRRWIDCVVEWAVARGYQMVEVVDWYWSESVAADFTDLAAHAVPVFYQRGEGPLPEKEDDLRRLSTPLSKDVGSPGVDLVWGYELEGLRIDGVRDWHAANMTLLEGTGPGGLAYTLPGYSAEKGVRLGRNVVTEPGFDAKPPVLLCDDVWCARNVRLEGHCILEKGTFLDEGVRMRDTVVCHGTYLGPGLEFENKIVSGNRVFDAATGAWTDIEERGVARRLGVGWQRPKWLSDALRFVAGRISPRNRR